MARVEKQLPTPNLQQWRIQGRGPGGQAPSALCLDQTEARRAQKMFLGNRVPAYLRVWMKIIIIIIIGKIG